MNNYYDMVFIIFLSSYSIFIIINECFINCYTNKTVNTDYKYFVNQICIKNNIPNELEKIINKYLY